MRQLPIRAHGPG